MVQDLRTVLGILRTYGATTLAPTTDLKALHLDMDNRFEVNVKESLPARIDAVSGNMTCRITRYVSKSIVTGSGTRRLENGFGAKVQNSMCNGVFKKY